MAYDTNVKQYYYKTFIFIYKNLVLNHNHTKVRIGCTGGESGIRTHGTAVKAVHSISSRAPSTGLSHLSTNT